MTFSVQQRMPTPTRGVQTVSFAHRTSKAGSVFIGIALVFIAGCGAVAPDSQRGLSTSDSTALESGVTDAQKDPEVILPVDGTIVDYNATYKRFGEYFQDRFRGYHVGDDIEVPPEDLGPGEVQEVPILAIADGIVKKIDWVSGYGGVIIVDHAIGGDRVNAIYGHIDVGSTNLSVGNAVQKGQRLAHLGDNRSQETDGERQHLHFALYRGDEIRLQGYEQSAAAVDNWINPADFFAQYGAETGREKEEGLMYPYHAFDDPQGHKIFSIDFVVPGGWDVEYIPALQALNLYTVSGSGTARERSQMLIRYFDADRFLTLNTVIIHNTADITVGTENYVARRYDIEKKVGVPDFVDQPSWRNQRHIVTDFRKTDGRTRYYVVAANPDLDSGVYERVLASMSIE